MTRREKKKKRKDWEITVEKSMKGCGTQNRCNTLGDYLIGHEASRRLHRRRKASD